MRKLLATILAFIYLVSVTGVTVHRHYCMDQPAGWGVFKNNSAVCPACGMQKSEKDNGCCKDELAFFKNTSDQQGMEATLQLAQPVLAVMPARFTGVLFTCPLSKTDKISRFIPPGPEISPPAYILHCVFRI